MGIAVARIGAQPLSVKCRICGRASRHGAKLCDQCIAAVKRARQGSTIASQLLPQSGAGVVSSPRPSVPRSPHRHSAWWSWLPAEAGGWGVLIAFALFGAAVGATGYLAIEEIAEKPVSIGVPPAPIDPSAVRASAAPVTESAASEPPREAVDVSTADAAPVIVESSQPAPVAEKRTARRSVTDSRIARGALARGKPAASTRTAEAETTAAAAGETGARALEVASAAIALEPPVPDRWETMNAALAGCSRENFLAGAVCAERARLQYCEGFWGQVPQCRAATRPGTSR